MATFLKKDSWSLPVRVCRLFELNEFVYCKCNLANLLEKRGLYLNLCYRKGAQLFPCCSCSGRSCYQAVTLSLVDRGHARAFFYDFSFYFYAWIKY